MGKRFFHKLSFILLALFILPSGVFANYIRPNDFMDKTGASRIAEIKRFQARNNLEVTGGLNPRTEELLYNPQFIAYDIVEKPPTDGYWIVVNKSRRILTLYQGKQSIGKYPIAVGKSSSPTPSYQGKIINKFVNPSWKGKVPGNHPNNPLGHRWMGLYVGGRSGYGIHGTIKPYEIGTYASAGCIRMFNYDIETHVFPKMKVHDPVWIGTDEQLASWGVRQIIDTVAEVPENPQEPIIEEPSVEREAVTVLEF
ncbi:MAG: L,D-transpeptidase family protein [Tissierellia bacterium]|nr:L,D-transpeptidase family protein [Tissierellia bacterium]